ncbi:MAG: FG-GAP-like repeat-containing protein, partial [Nitrospirales bacterium]
FTLFTSNLLPAGLTLDTSGLISGSPTAVVSRRFIVLASDPNQCSASRTYQMTVEGIPSVTTQNAVDVTSNSAKLKGNVFSSYLPTTSYFQWGTSTDYGNETPPQPLTYGMRKDIYANLGALLPHTTYHYRVTATNDAGASYGADGTFTTGPGGCSTTSFNYSLGINLDVSPFGFPVGDFNGDGNADFVVISNTSFRTYLGNGDGTFSNPIATLVDSASLQTAVGDFNADGRADVAVLVTGDNEVLILLGNPDGTFQSPLHYSVGNYPSSIAIGDFNSDGKLDLAIVNRSSGSLSILLGKGDGSFIPPVTYNIGSTPTAIVVGDFNGDGKQDLIVSGAFPNAVLFGGGDGTFQSPVPFTDLWRNVMGVGDFNGDGKADLAIQGHASVGIMLGNGDGTFQTPAFFVTPDSPTYLVVGDFNSDGRLDIATANQSANDISLLLGNGDGTLQPAINYGTDLSPSYLAMADFDNDGHPDLAALNSSPSTVSVLLNARSTCAVVTLLPDGLHQASFGLPYTETFSASGGQAPYTFAVTGGVLPSSFTLSATGTISGTANFTAPTTFTVTATDAGGTTVSRAYKISITGFPPPTIVTSGSSAVASTSASLNGTVNPNGFSTTAYFQWGSTTSYGTNTPNQSVGSGTSGVGVTANLTGLTPGTTYHYRVVASNLGGTTNGPDLILTTAVTPVPDAVAYSLTDLDGDGKSEIGFYRSGIWGILKSSQGYSYSATSWMSWGGAGLQPIVADFDGDKKADVAYIVAPAGGQTAAYAILRSTTGYNYAQAQYVPAGWPSLGDTPVVGDFDGDGKADPGIWRSSSGVWIVPLSGGNYTTYLFRQWGQAGDKPVIADFDGDGKDDIGFYHNGVWGILLSTKGYDTTKAQWFNWGGTGLQPIVADFDGDKKADIAYMVAPAGGQSAAYAILKSTTGYDYNQVQFIAAGWPSLGDVPVVGDFDGDGKADPGIWRASQGIWIIPLSTGHYATYRFCQWGQQEDIALPNTTGKR